MNLNGTYVSSRPPPPPALASADCRVSICEVTCSRCAFTSMSTRAASASSLRLGSLGSCGREGVDESEEC